MPQPPDPRWVAWAVAAVDFVKSPSAKLGFNKDLGIGARHLTAINTGFGRLPKIAFSALLPLLHSILTDTKL